MKKIFLALAILVCSFFTPTGCYVNFTEDDDLLLSIGCVKDLTTMAEQAIEESSAIKAFVEQQRDRTIDEVESLELLDRAICLCEQELLANQDLKAKAMSLLWYCRAAYFYKAHDYIQANADLDNALSWYPHNALIYFGKSRVYKKLHKNEQATRHAQQAARLGFDFMNTRQDEYEL